VRAVLSGRQVDWLWYAVLILAGVWAAWRAATYIGGSVGWPEVGWTAWLGAITLFRVVVLVILASLIWVPLGVWIGLHPRIAAAVQPIAQIAAAFPSNLFFPLVVAGIVAFHLTPDIWLSPLMILGTQWYILFNVVAGASIFPGDLLEAAASLRVKGWAWWRKVILPGIFPAYVTGAITAVGGSWNASIIAEVANWGKTKVEAHGLGAYIFDASGKDDLHRVLLGTVVMVLYVVAFNRLFWEPVFAWGARRLRSE
jgi:NitT/TauT family transport system permease protein